MKIDFTGRGIDIEEQVRNFTHTKLERIKRHLEGIQDISVILSVEKYRHKAEVSLTSHKRSYHGAEESADMYQSIDRAVEKLESQVKKYKDKQNSRKKNTTETIRSNGQDEPIQSGLNGGNIIPRKVSLKPMSQAEAVDELQEFNQEFIIFRDAKDDEVNVVFKQDDGKVADVSENMPATMGLEDAVDELQEINRAFIIFRNAEDDSVNVVYKRRDGNLGHIEAPH